MRRFHVRHGAGVIHQDSLAETLGANQKDERFLFFSPHDDDTAMGAGLLMAQAVDEGFDVHAVVVTDGRMGYCSAEQKASMARIRAREAIQSYALLGVPEERIHFLGLGDGLLYTYIGRRPAVHGDPEMAGFTGLENSFTHILRRLTPTRVFAPAGSDLHPDHQAVHKELLISVFHAAGDIWPELGAPCKTPVIYEYPIYVELEGEPEIMFEADEALLQRKMDAVACYVSQRQIKAIVEAIHRAGPVEFFRNIQCSVYHPEKYRKYFSAPGPASVTPSTRTGSSEDESP